MENSAILLVEDNAEEVELTLRALRQNNNRRQVFVVRDGVEAPGFPLLQKHLCGPKPLRIAQADPVGSQIAHIGWAGSAAPYSGRSTHQAVASCSSYFIERRAGPDRKLQEWGKLLHPQIHKLR